MINTENIGNRGTKGTLKLNLSSVVGCLARHTMVRMRRTRKMVMRTYWSPLVFRRIMLMARKVHKNVAAKVKKEDTRDVIL